MWEDIIIEGDIVEDAGIVEWWEWVLQIDGIGYWYEYTDWWGC